MHWFRIWENDGFDMIRTEWMKRAYKLDGTVEVEGKNGSSAKFKFKGIDAEGAMSLMMRMVPEIYIGQEQFVFYNKEKLMSLVIDCGKYKYRLCRIQRMSVYGKLADIN